MHEDLFSKVGSLKSDFSPMQEKVADYLLSHLQELPFKTTSEISRDAGVSEPTVIRFVRLLGYKGFVEFRDEFQRKLMEKFGPSERFQQISGVNKNLEEIIDAVFEKEIHNLRETRKGLDIRGIEEIAHEIIAARTKYIVGLRTSSGCAHVLGRLLSHILPNVLTISDGDIRMYENLRAVGKQDVLITISYPRYLKDTVEAVQFAKLRRATTITITDSKLSPTAQMSTYSIIAPSHSFTFANSYTASLIVVNLLATVISRFNKKEADAVLRECEKSLEPFQFFYNGNKGPSLQRKLK